MRVHAQERFEATPEAVGAARRFLQAAFAGRIGPEAESELTLVLSELASNAVRHARTPFVVTVEVNGRVRIEVQDGSTDAPIPRAPQGEGGRGLVIVDQLCDRWGTRMGGTTKCVWCELDLPAGSENGTRAPADGEARS